jgi:hypothetical protein
MVEMSELGVNGLGQTPGKLILVDSGVLNWLVFRIDPPAGLAGTTDDAI